MNLNFDRATRARIHTALLDAMPGECRVAENAFCESVAWCGSGDIDDLGDVLDLAARVDFHVYSEVHHSGCQFAEVDASALAKLYTPGTIRLAMRLAGYRSLARVSGQKMVWTDAPGDDPTIHVILEADDFGND
jgi:hypothetical protein